MRHHNYIQLYLKDKFLIYPINKMVNIGTAFLPKRKSADHKKLMKLDRHFRKSVKL